MCDRPYTLLSCCVSIDGYIGNAASRLLLSNDADFDRIDRVRTSCDAILVGAEAYALQDAGIDTYDANLALGHEEDERSYVAAAQMLDAPGVSRVALLSNNPDKARQFRSCGLTVRRPSRSNDCSKTTNSRENTIVK